MTYQVLIRKKAEKELKKFPKKDYLRILIILSELGRNPFLGKKLQGKLKDCYSLRAWPYRIIYQIRKKELLIIVIRIGHRQGVYND